MLTQKTSRQKTYQWSVVFPLHTTLLPPLPPQWFSEELSRKRSPTIFPPSSLLFLYSKKMRVCMCESVCWFQFALVRRHVIHCSLANFRDIWHIPRVRRETRFLDGWNPLYLHLTNSLSLNRQCSPWPHVTSLPVSWWLEPTVSPSGVCVCAGCTDVANLFENLEK